MASANSIGGCSSRPSILKIDKEKYHFFTIKRKRSPGVPVKYYYQTIEDKSVELNPEFSTFYTEENGVEIENVSFRATDQEVARLTAARAKLKENLLKLVKTEKEDKQVLPMISHVPGNFLSVEPFKETNNKLHNIHIMVQKNPFKLSSMYEDTCDGQPTYVFLLNAMEPEVIVSKLIEFWHNLTDQTHKYTQPATRTFTHNPLGYRHDKPLHSKIRTNNEISPNHPSDVADLNRNTM